MSDALPRQGRLAGIDYGTVRIGVAVTDPDQRLASPLEIYARRNAAADAAWFQTLASEERLAGFVVGLPIRQQNDDAAAGRFLAAARQIRRLRDGGRERRTALADDARIERIDSMR